MKERPILFSGLMVRAILEGRKTQTRRAIKQAHLGGPADAVCSAKDGSWIAWWGIEPQIGWQAYSDKQYPTGGGFFCPHGQPGDRLWVKESFQYITVAENEPFDARRPSDNCPVQLLYRADAAVEGWIDQCKWIPGIFMPRWATRLTLENRDVEPEQVQDMGENAAIAEGVIPRRNEHYLSAFVRLWDLLNAKRGYPWESNPWVWAITFQRV